MGDTGPLDSKAARVRILGPEFGAVYHALWNEVVQLRWEWKQYRSLFVAETVELLNEHAPEFFWLVQHVLSDHVIGSIAKLTDSPETRAQSNLTVRRLPALANLIDSRLGTDLDAIITNGHRSWESIRAWRHKNVAHLDLEVALGKRATPLQPVLVSDIDASVAGLTSVIDRVEGHCSPGVHSVYDIIGRRGDASTLRHILEQAKRYEEQRMDRLRTDRALREDLE